MTDQPVDHAHEISKLWALVAEGPVHPSLTAHDDYLDLLDYAVYALTD